MSTLPTAKTHNAANAFDHSEDHLLEFFSKAGSLYVNKKSYYGNESSAIELFKTAWRTGNHKECMQLLMWVRDVRTGAGNRSGARAILNWLANEYPEWIKANIGFIPQLGRFDDLFSLYGTSCEQEALQLWADYLNGKMDAGTGKGSLSGLAAKWADRQDAKLRAFMGMTPKAFRKMLVKKTRVVEQLMCAGKWEQIDYSGVPSVASSRYHNAFIKHDEIRYNSWKEALAKPPEEGGTTVNAGAIYPHDLVRLLKYGGSSGNLANAQFAALPDFMNGTNQRIMTICDFSGSMGSVACGSVTSMDVSLGLGLYCSDRLGKENPFYRMLIPFSDTSKLESWSNMTFEQAVQRIPNGYCGSTNIRGALRKILEAAKMFHATDDQIPNMLLIISDMQFDQGTTDRTPVNEALKEWEDAGYSRPKIVYWDTSGYQTQPATCKDKNVALVSGFSPSILTAVLGGKDFSPLAVMREALKKYYVVEP